MAVSEWSEHVHAVLSRAGLKRGGARERVIELLASQPCALSAVEIEDELRAQERPTARASVYRVLELLAEHGLVEIEAPARQQLPEMREPLSHGDLRRRHVAHVDRLRQQQQVTDRRREPASVIDRARVLQ